MVAWMRVVPVKRRVVRRQVYFERAACGNLLRCREGKSVLEISQVFYLQAEMG